MVKRDKLIDHIENIFGEELLVKAKMKDEMANGVQVLGKEEVEKAAFGVSLNLEFLEKAVKWGADLCVFHHGLDVRTHKALLSRSFQERLRLIFQNDLTIASYHYTLDAQPDIGNNAEILERLGADLDESFFDDWGYIGVFTEAQDVNKLKQKCEEIFGRDIYAMYSGNKKITRVGVCSGGAKPYAENIAEMQRERIELFIGGETSEHFPHQMKENGINYFVCGHYATETFGIKELLEDVKEEYGGDLETKFIDIKSPF